MKTREKLNDARADLMEAARLDHALTPAAEWILDNSYLIHTQITEVNRHLPRDYSGWSSAGGTSLREGAGKQKRDQRSGP